MKQRAPLVALTLACSLLLVIRQQHAHRSCRDDRDLVLKVREGDGPPDYQTFRCISNLGMVIAHKPYRENCILLLNPVCECQVPLATIPLTTALRMNDHNQVVGSIEDESKSEACCWDPQDGIRYLRYKDFRTSVTGLNNLGEAVGHYLDTIGRQRGCRWDSNGNATAFPTDDGIFINCAEDINDRGEIVGKAVVNTLTVPFYRDRDGNYEFIGNETWGHATAINNAGMVVGHLRSEYTMFAFLWTKEKGLVDLNTLLPESSPWWFNTAMDINDRGQILIWASLGEEAKVVLIQLQMSDHGPRLVTPKIGE